MNLRQKFFMLAILPAAFAMIAIALTVRYQAIALSRQQLNAVEAASLSAKEIELQHYVGLARNAIQPLYNGPDTPEARQAALDTLSRLAFGQDNYFFVYGLDGTSLMERHLLPRPDQYSQDIQDAENARTIQRLIAQAKTGGGLVRYMWEKPSSEQIMPKLSYVLALRKWNWMIGTGVYIDDVEATLAQSNRLAQSNINRTLLWITLIASCCLMVVGICGLVLNVTEYRSTDAKLKQLARQVVESQEVERARISRELHDGISQLLVSVKLLLESASMKMMSAPAAASVTLNVAIERLNSTLGEVRRISQALRPAMLDDLGIAAALEQLAREFGQHAELPVEVTVDGDALSLDDNVKTLLFRIAQEALTNIKRHADAQKVNILLVFRKDGIHLAITDDGRGFDVSHVYHDPKRGIGLRNMRERLDAVGGTLGVQSWPGTTTISAWVPLPQPTVSS